MLAANPSRLIRISATIRPQMATRWNIRDLARFVPGRRGAESDEPAADPRLGDLVGLDQEDLQIIERALPYTMTSVMRLRALVDAVRYCDSSEIPGAFVECGVWRGGSILTMIATLQAAGAAERDIHLYDTFEGMTEPTEHDRSQYAPPALETWQAASAEGEERPWPEFFGGEVFNEEGVRRLLESTGYPADRLHLVRGPVEETVPASAPEQIALLRLDTDWYESTLHEMQHLFPRLAPGGVLLIDDYGHWEGARRAVDEYLESDGAKLLLTAVDYTGRVAVKR